MGQKLHSKRQRKQKANASLKRKQFDRQDEQVNDVVSPPQRYALDRLSTAQISRACAATDCAALFAGLLLTAML